MWVNRDQLPPQRGAREAFHFSFAPRGGQRDRWRGSQDFRVIAIGNDYPASVGQEIFGIQHRAVKMRREAPVKPVTMIEVVGPLAIAEQIGAADLDLDNHDLALGIDAHQVCPAV